jgi:phosphohistidine phosphatase SixA
VKQPRHGAEHVCGRAVFSFLLRISHIAVLGLIALTASAAERKAGSDADEARLWQALKSGGHIVLMRHVQTEPGVGDPPNFNRTDCRTQRNLNDIGRDQARAWGKTFKERAIPVGGVYSSVWCRCVDTAKLAFGRVDTWPALNSHFDEPASAALQAEQVRGGIGVRMQTNKNLVLVTHQVNITALTNRTPAMGEAIILRWNGKVMNEIGSLKVQ